MRCAARCARTFQPRWRPSPIWPTATRWRCWAAHRCPSRRRAGPAGDPLALKRGGRQRNIYPRARQIATALRADQLAAPAPVTAAFAATTRAAVGLIAEINRQIADLEATLAEHFEAHPDTDIYLSLPGLGVVLGARVLGEFGDDPNRYTHAKSRKNYAGTSPLTIASGKKRAVLARHVRNRRLYDAIDQWAFCALTTSPGAQRSTTSAATPKTATTKPSAPWATASSASCTAVYATTLATTNTPPGHTAIPLRLDRLSGWARRVGA